MRRDQPEHRCSLAAGNFGKNTQAVRRLADVAAATGITIAHLALVCLLTRGWAHRAHPR
jgi:hypothetical protein